MECGKFIEEKVSGTESPEFRAHRLGCPGCMRDLEEIDEVRGLYREASVERYTGGVPSLRRFRGRASWAMAATAAAVMLVVLFVFLGEPSGEQTAAAPGTMFRARLEPWGREDARIDREFDAVWRGLESLERGR